MWAASVPDDKSKGGGRGILVVDLHHRGVGTGAEALHLENGEEPVLGGLAVADAEQLVDFLLDRVRIAYHARRGGADLRAARRVDGQSTNQISIGADQSAAKHLPSTPQQVPKQSPNPTQQQQWPPKMMR